MLTIRLARTGRSKRPFFRIVLTEHSKPVQAGYQKVLGWYDPLKKEMELDIEEIKRNVANGAKLSERVAKLVTKQDDSPELKKFIVIRERTRKKKNEDES